MSVRFRRTFVRRSSIGFATSSDGRAGGLIHRLDGLELEGDNSPLEEAIGREAVERYEAALQRLKPEEREAIIARVELGLQLRRDGRGAG